MGEFPTSTATDTDLIALGGQLEGLLREYMDAWLEWAPRMRAADLEYVGGGCLLLQRFAQLVEQPRVLDGDHGLIGKGLEQSNLSLREELGLAAAECDRANRDTFSHQRDAK